MSNVQYVSIKEPCSRRNLDYRWNQHWLLPQFA